MLIDKSKYDRILKHLKLESSKSICLPKFYHYRILSISEIKNACELRSDDCSILAQKLIQYNCSIKKTENTMLVKVNNIQRLEEIKFQIYNAKWNIIETNNALLTLRRRFNSSHEFIMIDTSSRSL